MSPFRPARLRRALIASAASAPLIVMASPAPAPAAAASTSTPRMSGFDLRLVRDINNARVSRGLRRVTLVAGTADVAHLWSCHLARYRSLTHNPELARALSLHGSPGWTTYGENIAWQSSSYGADHMFNRYMRSPAHKANMLNRSFRYIGVWTSRSSGRRWNTTDFVGATADSYHFSYGGLRVSC
jgi:uncharacterized protein YkwD